jgi:hypothetical protein
MLSAEQRSNLDQWVSEFPRFSHIITDPTMICFFSKEPPPPDRAEVNNDLWDNLTQQLAGLDHG